MKPMPEKSDAKADFVGRVDSTWLIKERGLILLLHADSPGGNIKPGEIVEVRIPGAQPLMARLTGTGVACGEGPCRLELLLSREFDKANIPSGAEIWRKP